MDRRVGIDEPGTGTPGTGTPGTGTPGARLLGPSVGAPLPTDGGPPQEPSGQLAARYRVTEELGRGQMGIVYRAVQTALGREVAVKYPTVESAVGAERFLREARLLAKLSHPNLVRVLDADLDAGRPFLVLEFVMGYSLMQYRERAESLAPAEAVGLICQICDGLAAAHEAGIIHRDIKSGNVLVSHDGVAKLADFGLARGAEVGLTEAGTLLGTPAYLAPEIARGEPASPASDLYALGVLLFELVTGRLPFLGLSAAEVLNKHLRETPPRLARHASDIPDELEALYAALMAKDPRARPASAAAVGRELRLAMGHSASVTALEIPQLVPEPPPRRTTRRTAAPASPTSPTSPTSDTARDAAPGRAREIWSAALGFAVALALSQAAWSLLRGPHPSPSVEASKQQLTTTAPSDASGAPAPSSPSPDASPDAAERWAPLTPLSPDPAGRGRWLSQVDEAEMVRVAAGPAIRGSNEVGPDERPVRVLLIDGFYIDRKEVTNRQYDRFTALVHHAPRPRNPKSPELDLPDHPVVGVLWQDAVDYCAWAKKRLPTEAEWEKAARGPEGLRYPWGNDDRAKPPANFADPMGISPDGYATTAPVGSFPAGASPYGALDMAGNVWEWCADWYGDHYYETSPEKNPPGPASGRWKASRGGSHMTYDVQDMLSAYRKRGEPLARHTDQGFRCVRPLD